MAGASFPTFRKCECGAEFKFVLLADGKKHRLLCDCRRQIEIVGTALNVYRRELSGSSGRHWTRVSPEKIMELPLQPDYG
jgi:hypothetical protein